MNIEHVLLQSPCASYVYIYIYIMSSESDRVIDKPTDEDIIQLDVAMELSE